MTEKWVNTYYANTILVVELSNPWRSFAYVSTINLERAQLWSRRGIGAAKQPVEMITLNNI